MADSLSIFPVIPKGSMMDRQTRREAEGKRREEQEKELQVVLLRLQNEYRNQDIVSVISQHGTSQVDKCCLVSLLLFIITIIDPFISRVAL